MELPRQTTVFEAAAVLICTIIGVGVLALPRFAVDAGGSGAPLVTLVGILLSFIGLWLITKLGVRFPGKTIIQYSQDIVGKWIARAGAVFIIIFFAVLTALAAREFGEVVVASILERTPMQATILAMLLLAAISSRSDIRTFAYIHAFYLPFILAPGLGIVLLAMKNAKMIYLEPVLGNSSTPFGLLAGVLTVAALFQGSFIMTSVIPTMREPGKAMKASTWGMVVSGGLYLLIVIVTLAVFGTEETKLALFPTLELAKFTAIPGEFLERLDGLFIIVWVVAVFTTLYSSYFLTARSLSELFVRKDHRSFSLFILPFVFILAVLPQNVIQMYNVIEFVGRIGLLITIVYPGILLLLAWVRKLKDEPSI